MRVSIEAVSNGWIVRPLEYDGRGCLMSLDVDIRVFNNFLEMGQWLQENVKTFEELEELNDEK